MLVNATRCGNYTVVGDTSIVVPEDFDAIFEGSDEDQLLSGALDAARRRGRVPAVDVPDAWDIGALFVAY